MGYRSQTAIENDHDFDTTFTNEYDTQHTPAANAVAIITPTSGKRLKIVHANISTESTSGRVRLFFATSGNTVTVGYAGLGNIIATDDPMLIRGAVDEPLLMESALGVDKKYYVSIDYAEE